MLNKISEYIVQHIKMRRRDDCADIRGMNIPGRGSNIQCWAIPGMFEKQQEGQWSGVNRWGAENRGWSRDIRCGVGKNPVCLTGHCKPSTFILSEENHWIISNWEAHGLIYISLAVLSLSKAVFISVIGLLLSISFWFFLIRYISLLIIFISFCLLFTFSVITFNQGYFKFLVS